MKSTLLAVLAVLSYGSDLASATPPTHGPYATEAITVKLDGQDGIHLDESDPYMVIVYPKVAPVDPGAMSSPFPLVVYAHGFLGGGFDMLGCAYFSTPPTPYAGTSMNNWNTCVLLLLLLLLLLLMVMVMVTNSPPNNPSHSSHHSPSLNTIHADHDLFHQMASHGLVIAAPKSCSTGCKKPGGASNWTCAGSECVLICMRACVHACMRACVHACA